MGNILSCTWLMNSEITLFLENNVALVHLLGVSQCPARPNPGNDALVINVCFAFVH